MLKTGSVSGVGGIRTDFPKMVLVRVLAVFASHREQLNFCHVLNESMSLAEPFHVISAPAAVDGGSLVLSVSVSSSKLFTDSMDVRGWLPVGFLSSATGISGMSSKSELARFTGSCFVILLLKAGNAQRSFDKPSSFLRCS